MNVRSHLALLIAVVLLPVVLFTGLVLDMLLSKEREAALRSMHELARASVLAMDRELTYAVATGQALAKSNLLSDSDFARFYAQAKAASEGKDIHTALLSEDGQQLFNTIVPFGTALPAPSAVNRERTRAVLARNQPQISNLILGTTTRRHVVSAEVPVRTTDGRRFLLDEWMFADALNGLLPSKAVPASWLITVYDREGNTIARNRKPEEFVGKGPSKVIRETLQKPEGVVFKAANREGREMYGVHARSSLSGWVVAIGVPVDEIESAAVQALYLAVPGLLIAIALAALGAFIFLRRLVRSIDTVAVSARMLGQNRVPAVEELPVAEMRRLQVAMHEAGKRLHATEAEHNRLLEEARDARAVAESQNRAKDEFLAMLGHELRNPLSAITSAVMLLDHPGVSAETAQRAREIIGRQSSHLGSIVDDLLDAHRVLSGKITLSRTRIDLGKAARECLDAFHARGATARHKLVAELESAWIDADPTRLEQMMGNLVENALKYTPEGGGITVTVHAGDGHAVFSVADTGVGMERSLLPRAFDVFVQGKVINRSKGGLGIGLSVVHSLAVRHGASVSAESAGPGLGSTFTIRFPLASGTPPVSEEHSPAVAAQSASVLVIEDNRDVREMMCAMLAGAGYTVVGADSGKSGLQRATECPPDVALVDIDLPDISGYEVAKQLRAGARTANIRLIAVTGYGQQSDKARALDSGFDLHLKKPVKIDDVIASIDRQLPDAAA